MIRELADMIACDVYYNEFGNLVISSGIYNISYLKQPTLWEFSDQELEYLRADLTYNFSTVRNRVTVVAYNSNSTEVYEATAENNNPKSPTRIELIGQSGPYCQ